MSHFTVLVIGENVGEQLDPFWELDLSREELINDPRAEFEVSSMVEDLENEFAKFKEEHKEDIEKGEKEYFIKYRDCSALDWVNDWSGEYLNKEGTAYGYYHNPNAKWDWFQVGGRWAGKLKLKDGVAIEEYDDPNFSWGWDEEAKDELKNSRRTDSALKKDIDFESMIKEAGERARKKYEMVSNMFGGEIPKIKYSWPEVMEGENFKFMTIDEKRAFYHSQEPLEKLKWMRNNDKLSKEEKDFALWGDLANFQCSKEEYCNSASSREISTFAVLKDGEWFEKGSMGWWGLSSNTEEESERWDKEFYNHFIKDLPEDTRLTVVDCHI